MNANYIGVWIYSILLNQSKEIIDACIYMIIAGRLQMIHRYHLTYQSLSYLSFLLPNLKNLMGSIILDYQGLDQQMYMSN